MLVKTFKILFYVIILIVNMQGLMNICYFLIIIIVKKIDVESIINEIDSEVLSDKELYDRIESYFKAHNFSSPLFSCGACGIQEFSIRK